MLIDACYVYVGEIDLLCLTALSIWLKLKTRVNEGVQLDYRPHLDNGGMPARSIVFSERHSFESWVFREPCYSAMPAMQRDPATGKLQNIFCCFRMLPAMWQTCTEE